MRLAATWAVVFTGCHWIYPFAPSSGPEVSVPDLGPDIASTTTLETGSPRDGDSVDTQDAALDGTVGGPCAEADINEDGSADLLDMVVVIRCIGKTSSDPGCGRADINGQGGVSATDAVALRNLLRQCDPEWFPCSTTAESFESYAATMALCSGSSPVDQCSAEATYCNTSGGWHMCTASEFLDRGGRQMFAGSYGWIASCVRDGQGVFVPSDQVCACLNAQDPNEVVYGWMCGTGTPLHASPLHLGVHTFYACRVLGANTPHYEAYWIASNTGMVEYSSAVCCR